MANHSLKKEFIIATLIFSALAFSQNVQADNTKKIEGDVNAPVSAAYQETANAGDLKDVNQVNSDLASVTVTEGQADTYVPTHDAGQGDSK